ncbi:MAG TPA: prepilin-type N-terminal cleavage/methylation domain-containing protein [Nitrospiria bacterium]|nr:prepilin-type N-terminal cleavage/methylation domain-containing protein [Nitrospiria bacterium]
MEEKSLNNGLIERYGAGRQGFTLIEMLIVVALLSTLAALGVPIYQSYLDRARNTTAAADIGVLQLKIQVYQEEDGKLPDSLSDVKWDKPDPWGHPYQYLNFADAGPSWKGKARKDKFLVPLNSTYDLYSNGKDGQTKTPLTAKVSQDDILRANDGAFIGLASMY